MRRLLVLALALLLVPVARAGAQQVSARFEIVAVGDSTIAFRTGKLRWVLPASRGIAVDPTRRDEMVARFRVLAVDGEGVATALVTGQTTQLTTTHVVLMQPPRPRAWWRGGPFWAGSAAGLILGFVFAAA